MVALKKPRNQRGARWLAESGETKEGTNESRVGTSDSLPCSVVRHCHNINKRGCTQSDFVAAAERNRASHGHHAPPRAVKAAEVFERRPERAHDKACVLA